jgi:hypothetical protein
LLLLPWKEGGVKTQCQDYWKAGNLTTVPGLTLAGVGKTIDDVGLNGMGNIADGNSVLVGSASMLIL